MRNFKFTPLDDGSYSVKIYGKNGTISSEVDVPKSFNGKPVTQLGFGSTIDANFSRLRIPASVTDIRLPENMNLTYKVRIFAQELEVDGENERYRTDGKALFSKDGRILYRLFPRYIEEYEVPDGTEIVAGNAFTALVFLKSVALPEGLREIGKPAFAHCTALTELHIPSTATDVDWGTFPVRTCAVEKIRVSPDNRRFRSENGVVYDKETTALIKAPITMPEVFAVPESVTEIAEGAFCGCKGLKRVILPEGCAVIGDYAFANCAELRSVNFPEGLEHIGVGAFAGVDTVDVTLPKSLGTVEDAFYNSGKITVYDTLESGIVFFCRRFPPRIMPDRELIVKNAETDEVKLRLWIGFRDSDTRHIRHAFFDCFYGSCGFDFDRFDGKFHNWRHCLTKACYAAYRLRGAPPPKPEAEREFRGYLRENGVDILTRCIDGNELNLFRRLAELALTEKNVAAVVDRSVERGLTELTAFLLDYRNKRFGALPDLFEL